MKLKKSILLLILVLPIFAFNVEFTKIYKKYIIPKKDAILIETNADNLTFPFQYIKTDKGYILFGNLRKINYYLENNFYAPNDAKFKNIKIAIINPDIFQYNIIKNISKIYKQCTIKSLIFLTPDQNKIILKPTYITIKYKVILSCK